MGGAEELSAIIARFDQFRELGLKGFNPQLFAGEIDYSFEIYIYCQYIWLDAFLHLRFVIIF